MNAKGEMPIGQNSGEIAKHWQIDIWMMGYRNDSQLVGSQNVIMGQIYP
jgi:hypothetical protein